MRPVKPNPLETAQWIVETHARNIIGSMNQFAHSEYMANLSTVCDEMEAAELRQAMGAVVDIAEELLLELADSGVEPDRVLELLLDGRGRLHVSDGLPTNASVVGAAAAFRLASTVARIALWRHEVDGCRDEAILDAYDADCEEVAAAISRRCLGELIQTGSYLRGFSQTLSTAGTPPAAALRACPSRDGAGCRGHIDDWDTAIGAQSEALSNKTGTTDRAWALYAEFFDPVT